MEYRALKREARKQKRAERIARLKKKVGHVIHSRTARVAAVALLAGAFVGANELARVWGRYEGWKHTSEGQAHQLVRQYQRNPEEAIKQVYPQLADGECRLLGQIAQKAVKQKMVSSNRAWLAVFETVGDIFSPHPLTPEAISDHRGLARSYRAQADRYLKIELKEEAEKASETAHQHKEAADILGLIQRHPTPLIRSAIQKILDRNLKEGKYHVLAALDRIIKKPN